MTEPSFRIRAVQVEATEGDQTGKDEAPEPAPWAGQRVKIEDLPDFKARWGLQMVGGDPDLYGQPWRPQVYLEPATADR